MPQRQKTGSVTLKRTSHNSETRELRATASCCPVSDSSGLHLCGATLKKRHGRPDEGDSVQLTILRCNVKEPHRDLTYPEICFDLKASLRGQEAAGEIFNKATRCGGLGF